MLKEQEEALNPQKYAAQRSFSDIIDENTVPGQIKKENEFKQITVG